MPNYLVKTAIQMGKRFEPGDTIALSEEQAAAMPWAIEALPEPAPPARSAYIAVRTFQFHGDKVAEGQALELTAQEAEKLGPERVHLAPPPEQPPAQE